MLVALVTNYSYVQYDKQLIKLFLKHQCHDFQVCCLFPTFFRNDDQIQYHLTISTYFGAILMQSNVWFPSLQSQQLLFTRMSITAMHPCASMHCIYNIPSYAERWNYFAQVSCVSYCLDIGNIYALNFQTESLPFPF